jgi:outer membrane protein TolC
MGRPLDLQGELEEPPMETPENRAANASVRPEMVARLEQVKASEARVREVSGGFYPELFTRLSADYLDNRHAREQTLYSASIGLRVNLFDGFATTAQHQQALTSLRQEEDRLRDLEARLQLELQQAANDVQVARERIAVTEQAIAQSEENLRINRDRYQEQVGTATEVLDAQTLLTQTKADYFSALYDFQVASARLKRAQGTL